MRAVNRPRRRWSLNGLGTVAAVILTAPRPYMAVGSTPFRLKPSISITPPSTARRFDIASGSPSKMLNPARAIPLAIAVRRHPPLETDRSPRETVTRAPEARKPSVAHYVKAHGTSATRPTRSRKGSAKPRTHVLQVGWISEGAEEEVIEDRKTNGQIAMVSVSIF